MKLERLKALTQDGVAFDTETHLRQPGLGAPPLVLASASRWRDGAASGILLSKDDALDVYREIISTPRLTLIGAHIAYDNAVMAVYAASRGLDLLPQIFGAYEDGRVFDVLIAEGLHGVAEGTHLLNPWTGRRLADPETGKPGGYSLATVTEIVLGRSDAKKNDRFRSSYALFDGWPLDQLPPEAQTYPVDDADNTLLDALAQTGHIPRLSPHVWPRYGEQRCESCGYLLSVKNPQHFCAPRAWSNRNLHDLRNQVYAAWALHLGGIHGFIVDQDAVDKLEHRVTHDRPERAKPFIEAGILVEKVEKGVKKLGRKMGVIKRKVALAYGARGACSVCSGTGKVISPKAKHIRCAVCKGKPIGDHVCAACDGLGSYPNPKQTINCEVCDASGLDLDSADVPRTNPDNPETEPGIGTGRDVLNESGDEELINFASFMEDAKIPETYIPWLREGRIILGFDDKARAFYKTIPLCLRPNVLKETGRTSYSGVVQLLPRKGGVRECIVARPGYVFCSVDYEAGELITHAESCYRICGFSALGDALLAGVKPHNAFAATILGLDYNEFQRLFKSGDKRCIDTRQAAKPPNFGFPGRMGPAKLVYQQRCGGPDTPCVHGTTWVIDENTGERVRGYKGLRFCILMGTAERCGEEMVREWNGRPCPRVCKACCQAAAGLKVDWLRQWPENPPYFEHVSEVENSTGEVVHHVSERVRGGLQGEGNAIANGYFQGLLADAAKAAACQVSRECYDSSVRLPDGQPSPLYGSRLIVFAHDEIVAELPEHNMHAAAMRLSEIMVYWLRTYCPRMAKAVAAEPALMRRWYKGAKTIYKISRTDKPANDNDTLDVWEPKEKAA